MNSEQFSVQEPVSMIENEVLNHNREEFTDNFCVAPTTKERNEKTILDEPMVAKALELFAPKKVRIKRNS